MLDFAIIPIEIAGYSRGLLDGLLKVGRRAQFYEIAAQSSSCEADGPWGDHPNIVRVYRKSEAVIDRFRWYFQRANATRIIGLYPKIVICQFNMSMLPFGLDLIYLRLRGCKILSLAGHGSESRPPHMDGQGSSDLTLACQIGLLAAAAKKIVSLKWRFSLTNWFFCSPATGHFIPGNFFNTLDLGHPLSDSEFRYKTSSPDKRSSDVILRPLKQNIDQPFRILHARASFGSAKGTEYIRSVIAQLQLTHNIEFTEMIGVSKQQLAQAMSNHDLLIDQAYSDYPLPVISAEAMARGLPSLVCGYFKDEYRPYLKFDPPVLTSRPENLEALMRELLNWDDDDWTKLKDSSYAFVSAHFRTEEVALKLLSVIAGGTNQSDVSITNRKSITYFQGAGTSESVMRAIRKSRIMKFSPGRKWAFPPKE